MILVSLIKRIYGILFVVGDEGVTLERLAKSLDVSQDDIQESLNQLKINLQSDSNVPIELVNYNQYYQLVTKQELESDIVKFAKAPFNQRLTRAAIETLAIIAYRQPITRMGVDEVRGVSSQSMLHNLLGRDLIQEVGRVEAPGRPVLYGTTDYFMDYFGLSSLEELPEIEPLALDAQLVSEELFDQSQWKLEVIDVDKKSEEDE